jgi:hypothetical protein
VRCFFLDPRGLVCLRLASCLLLLGKSMISQCFFYPYLFLYLSSPIIDTAAFRQPMPKSGPRWTRTRSSVIRSLSTRSLACLTSTFYPHPHIRITLVFLFPNLFHLLYFAHMDKQNPSANDSHRGHVNQASRLRMPTRGVQVRQFIHQVG